MSDIAAAAIGIILGIAGGAFCIVSELRLIVKAIRELKQYDYDQE